MQKNSSRELEHLRTRLQPLRQQLLDHRLYRQLHHLAALRRFMEHHVFAVWDFMSLLKALQRHFCRVEVPWTPSITPFACRLVNEIVLDEESDISGDGEYASHFELYHRAMQQCGASTATIDQFVAAVRAGQKVGDALEASHASEPIRRFVRVTFDIIESGDIGAIAAAFTFGREDLLPTVFRKIVEELNVSTHGRLDRFRHYLDRHIQVDDDVHGPMAQQLIVHLCGVDGAKWEAAGAAAARALDARLELWNSMV